MFCFFFERIDIEQELILVQMAELNFTFATNFLEESSIEPKHLIGDVDVTEFCREIDKLNASVTQSEIERIENQLTISFSE